MLPDLVKKTQIAKKGAVARAMERFVERYEEQQRITHLGFLIDATASREDTWEKAQAIQSKMFRTVAGLGRLSLRLVHFGGGILSDCGTMDDPKDVAAVMARVRCVCGYTQIVGGLMAFLAGPSAERVSAIILIGDCFEEHPKEVEMLGVRLKDAGIRVFAFHEGEDTTAERVFRRLADVTDGAFAKFGAGLPLADLCEGVALLASGGTGAVKRLPNKRVRQLLLTGPAGK
jgi:hypothetical protein